MTSCAWAGLDGLCISEARRRGFSVMVRDTDDGLSDAALVEESAICCSFGRRGSGTIVDGASCPSSSLPSRLVGSDDMFNGF